VIWLNRKILFLIIIAVVASIFLVWFFQDVEPVKSLVAQIRPTFDNIIQVLKDNMAATITAITGSSGAIVLLLKSKMNNATNMIAGQASQKLEQASTELGKIVTEKLKLADQVTSQTGIITELQNKLFSITDQVGNSTKQLLESQSLLATANRRIEDLTKDNETLRKAIEFMKANVGAYIAP
jgi:chromosome segregation ATPase